MFKSIQNSNLDKLKNGTILPGRQALDFALAEFSSAIEMLQAAKLVENKSLNSQKKREILKLRVLIQLQVKL